MKSKFVSVEEAAAILNLKPKTVYNRKGGTAHLVRVRLGRRVQLLREEVEQFARDAIEQGEKMQRAIAGE